MILRPLKIHAIARASLLGLFCLMAPSSHAAAPSPRLLVELADLSSPAISPDGRTVAFREERASIERNTYESAWFVQPLDGRTPAQRIADGGTPLRLDAGVAFSEPPHWSPDGRWIYFRALIGGEVQVWRAAVDGSCAEAVTRDDANVEAFTLGADGRALLYRVRASRTAIARAEDDEYDAGVHIDATTPLAQGLHRSSLIDGRLATSRLTRNWSERTGLLANSPVRWKAVDLATLAARDANDADLAAFAGALPPPPGARIDPSGDIYTARSTETGAVARVRFKASAMVLQVADAGSPGEIQDCAAPACQDQVIMAIVWRPGHRQVLFTTNDRDRGRAQSLRVWDTASGQVRILLSAPGQIGGGRQLGLNEPCAVGARYAACVSAAAGEPPQVDLVDLQTGARTAIYTPNAALANIDGPRPVLLRWTDPKGHAFTGQFFPPALNRPGVAAPLFITYYSCDGFLRGGLGDEWPLVTLAGSGIAALCVNEAAADSAHPDQVSRYELALSGVRAVVRLLARQGVVDPARVGMGGLSFGSDVVLWAAMKSDLLTAASVTSPSISPNYYQLHSLQGAAFRAGLKEYWGLGAPDETPSRWKAISPAFNTAAIHAPVLFQMPEQEYVEALDTFLPLAASSTPADMYVFPNEPHIKVQPRHKLAAYERNLDWFRFWLQDYVDPDPAKAAQYDHWRALRARAQQAGLHPGRGDAEALATSGQDVRVGP